MAKKIKIFSEGLERHVCKVRRRGNWLIFKCPDCSYHRKYNPITDEMKVVNKGDIYALHSGSYEPDGLQLDSLNLN